MYSSVSVDGFVADENDQPGPLVRGRWRVARILCPCRTSSMSVAST